MTSTVLFISITIDSVFLHTVSAITLRGIIASFLHCSDDCEPGSYINDDMTGCLMCPVGFYQPEMGADYCLGCSPGFTTRGVGASSSDECKREHKSHSHIRVLCSMTSSCLFAVPMLSAV